MSNVENPQITNLKNALNEYCKSTEDTDTKVAAFVEKIDSAAGNMSGGALRNSRGRFLSTRKRNTRGRNRNARGRFLSRKTNRR